MKKLLAIDMDSTLVAVEVIDELARLHGVGEAVSAITHEAMVNGMDFQEALKRRVALLKGLSFEYVSRYVSNLPLNPGAEYLLQTAKEKNYCVALISGGFSIAAQALQKRLPIDYICTNTLLHDDVSLLGEVSLPILDAGGKAYWLREIARVENILPENTVAVGDGANDALMLQAAGCGLAFYGKAALCKVAKASIQTGGLEQVVPYL